MFKPPTCEFCRFWRKNEKQKASSKKSMGQCRVDGPQMGQYGYGYWPMTANDDFCYKGEPQPAQLLVESQDDDSDVVSPDIEWVEPKPEEPVIKEDVKIFQPK